MYIVALFVLDIYLFIYSFIHSFIKISAYTGTVYVRLLACLLAWITLAPSRKCVHASRYETPGGENDATRITNTFTQTAEVAVVALEVEEVVLVVLE